MAHSVELGSSSVKAFVVSPQLDTAAFRELASIHVDLSNIQGHHWPSTITPHVHHGSVLLDLYNKYVLWNFDEEWCTSWALPDEEQVIGSKVCPNPFPSYVVISSLTLFEVRSLHRGPRCRSCH